MCKHWHPGFVFICDVGERGLISHKFKGTGEGGAGMCTEGRPRSWARVHGAAGCEPGVQLADARWAKLAAGRVHNGCGPGVQLAVARWARLSAGRVNNGRRPGVQLAVALWARLSAGRVHNGRAAGGCPMGHAVSWAGAQWAWARCAAGGCQMGQAVSWASAQWACSWRLPDGPGCQLGGCTMGVQLAVAWWARLAAGQVHYVCAAGGCPMGQAVSWAGAQWACSWRLPDGPGWQLGRCTMCRTGSWVYHGSPGVLPRIPDTHDMQARSISHTKIIIKASDDAQIIYIFRYRISTVLYMHISKA